MVRLNVSLVWEVGALDDRTKIYEFLSEYNPIAAEKTDDEIERCANLLISNPELGVKRDGFDGRCMVMSSVPFIIFYYFDESCVHVMKVLHQKQRFP